MYTWGLYDNKHLFVFLLWICRLLRDLSEELRTVRENYFPFSTQVKMRSNWSKVGPNPIGLCPFTKKTHTQTPTHAGEDTMWRIKQRLEFYCHEPKKTKGCWQPPEPRIQTWDSFSLRTSNGNQLCQHIDLGLPASSTTQDKVSVVLNHPVCGDSWHEPQESITSPMQGVLQ